MQLLSARHPSRGARLKGKGGLTWSCLCSLPCPARRLPVAVLLGRLLAGCKQKASDVGEPRRRGKTRSFPPTPVPAWQGKASVPLSCGRIQPLGCSGSKDTSKPPSPLFLRAASTPFPWAAPAPSQHSPAHATGLSVCNSLQSPLQWHKSGPVSVSTQLEEVVCLN